MYKKGKREKKNPPIGMLLNAGTMPGFCFKVVEIRNVPSYEKQLSEGCHRPCPI
jgi:hypothetical protein